MLHVLIVACHCAHVGAAVMIYFYCRHFVDVFPELLRWRCFGFTGSGVGTSGSSLTVVGGVIVDAVGPVFGLPWRCCSGCSALPLGSIFLVVSLLTSGIFVDNPLW